MAGGVPSDSPGEGANHGGDQSAGASSRGRSRSPRARPGAGSAHSLRPQGPPLEQVATRPPPPCGREPRGPNPGLIRTASAQGHGGTVPRGWGASTSVGVPPPHGAGAAPNFMATAAALASQLPLHQAAVAASQAARAAAATVPVDSPGQLTVVPMGTSLAVLEAQVAALGSLLLALQGIVLQLIAVVNLMRCGH